MLRALIVAASLMAALPAAAQPAPAAPDDSARHAMRERMRHIREVCATDTQTFCANAGDERGARRQCLRENAAKFSQPCRDALEQMSAWRAAHPRPERGAPEPAPQLQ